MDHGPTTNTLTRWPSELKVMPWTSMAFLELCGCFVPWQGDSGPGHPTMPQTNNLYYVIWKLSLLGRLNRTKVSTLNATTMLSSFIFMALPGCKTCLGAGSSFWLSWPIRGIHWDHNSLVWLLDSRLPGFLDLGIEMCFGQQQAAIALCPTKASPPQTLCCPNSVGILDTALQKLKASIYISLYLSTYFSISIYIYLSISIYIYIYLYLSIYVYIYIHLYLYLSISIYLYLALSISIYLYLFPSISIYFYLFLSNLSISIYFFLSIYVLFFFYFGHHARA